MNRVSYLLLLLVLIPVIIVLIRNYTSNIKNIKHMNSMSEELAQKFFYKYFIMSICFVMFLTFTIISLIGISWKTQYELQEYTTLDIAILIDVSNSMSGDDIRPTRLKKSLAIAQALVIDDPGIRYSVSVFKGEGFNIVPMTDDIASVKNALDNINSGIINYQGTNLKSGLDVALNSFPSDKESSKILFLFSDGGDENIDLSSTIENYKENLVTVNSVIVGTSTGAVLKTADKEDMLYQGKKVIVSVNSDLIDSFTSATSGNSYHINYNLLISKLRSKITDEYNSLGKESYIEKEHDEYAIFLGIGIFFLMLQNLIRIFAWKKKF